MHGDEVTAVPAERGHGAAAAAGRRALSAHLVRLAAAALPLLVCGGLLVYGSGRGLDLTDETFYLVWTRDPEAHALVYQPFGYLLHPLFSLVGFDLQAYRLAGFAIAAAAGALLGFSLAPPARARPAFALYGAGAALTIFFPWIVTPSYNSAANVAAMLGLSGILLAFAARPAWRAAGAGAGAAGLCLAFFSKPPLFAIALAAMLVLTLVARRKTAAPALAAAVLLGLALLSLFIAPAAIPALVRRMAATQHILALTNTPAALPAKLVRDWAAVPLALSGAAVAAGLALALRGARLFRWPAYASVALSLVYSLSVLPDALDGEIPDFIGLALVLLVLGYAGLLQDRQEARVKIAFLLLAAPFAVALGTFNNQWAQLNFSMAFPFLALFALAAADPARWRRRSALALSLAGPASLMLLAASAPYSLPASIFEQQVPVRPPLAAGTIRVDPETAAFVEEGRGLASGALLIDLSGTGPGVAAVLGGRAPVLAWLNPATPSWPDVVWSRLRPGQRASAWFVAPVWSLFETSAPARWLAAHRQGYCATSLPEMPFWGEERTLQLWRPCARGPAAARSS